MIDAATSINAVTDNKALSALKQAARNHDPEALREVAKQFESLFIGMVLKSMRDANNAFASSDLLGDRQSVEFYQDMHDKQLALEMSKNGGMGLQDILVRQLSPQYQQDPLDHKSTDSLGLHRVPTRPARQLPGGAKSPVITESFGFESAEDFIKKITPLAKKAAAELGLDSKMLVAQAALETGWGQHILRSEQGGGSNNLFNIKAGRDWQGPTVSKTTLEYSDGIAHKERAQFRAYPSLQASFRDYVDFIKQNDRYKPALSARGDGASYMQALQDAGYATDPNYANKVTKIAKSEQLKVKG